MVEQTCQVQIDLDQVNTPSHLLVSELTYEMGVSLLGDAIEREL